MLQDRLVKKVKERSEMCYFSIENNILFDRSEEEKKRETDLVCFPSIKGSGCQATENRAINAEYC